MSKGNQIHKKAKHRSSDTNLKKKGKENLFIFGPWMSIFIFMKYDVGYHGGEAK